MQGLIQGLDGCLATLYQEFYSFIIFHQIASRLNLRRENFQNFPVNLPQTLQYIVKAYWVWFAHYAS